MDDVQAFILSCFCLFCFLCKRRKQGDPTVAPLPPCIRYMHDQIVVLIIIIINDFKFTTALKRTTRTLATLVIIIS
jgi:hypothetical protein